MTLKNGKTYERKLPNIAATLYTEVHSHPLSAADFLVNSNKHMSEIKKWYELATADFDERMPEGVDWAAVMHLDEAFIRFHIVAIQSWPQCSFPKAVLRYPLPGSSLCTSKDLALKSRM